MTPFTLKTLPLQNEIETTKILKKSISANRALARLNGVAKIIPNSAILINSLVLQEAKDSSEIENIITTHDELYRANLDIKSVTNEAKLSLIRRIIIDFSKRLEPKIIGKSGFCICSMVWSKHRLRRLIL